MKLTHKYSRLAKHYLLAKNSIFSKNRVLACIFLVVHASSQTIKFRPKNRFDSINKTNSTVVSQTLNLQFRGVERFAYYETGLCASMKSIRKKRPRPCCLKKDDECIVKDPNSEAECFCDQMCSQYGDCCKDFEDVCVWMEELPFNNTIAIFNGASEMLSTLLENVGRHTMYDKLLTHGCNCPLFETNFENFKRSEYGGPAVDQLDQLCKNILKNRHCLTMGPVFCRQSYNKSWKIGLVSGTFLFVINVIFISIRFFL